MSPLSPAAKAIRRAILRASAASGQGHIPTSFSIVEMLCAVYDTMRHDPSRPDWLERDIFVLSKGHATLGLYCVLAQYGYFPVEDVDTFGAFASRFGCHPDRLKVPGVEVSTGSLGHGIAVATGMALAFTLQESPRRVYALIGDGEANEGSVWEAIMVATHQRLNRLTLLFDFNQSQKRSLPIPNLSERLQAFGCDARDVDGHDLAAITSALATPSDRVRAIVCHTVKGSGSATLAANIFEWHRKSPNAEQLQRFMDELDADAV
jgi:transketolase